MVLTNCIYKMCFLLLKLLFEVLLVELSDELVLAIPSVTPWCLECLLVVLGKFVSPFFFQRQHQVRSDFPFRIYWYISVLCFGVGFSQVR